MNCKTIEKQLTSGIEPTAEMRTHIDHCESCRALAESQSAVSRSLKMLAATDVPIGTADRAFRAALSGETVIATPSFLDRLVPIATPFAAGAAAAAAIALLLSGQGVQTSPDADSDADVSALVSDDIDDFAGSELLALGDDQ